MFNRLPENSPDRRDLALEINQEYNVFCAFPNNVSSEERLAIRKAVREMIKEEAPEVGVKHVIALREGGIDREYEEEAARLFEVGRAIEQGTA
jgi:hypothetical protein